VAEGNWTRVDQQLPPKGVVVDTISPGGVENKLKLMDGLWFFADASMYVYYVPEFWRHV
jgi:hypothetical protein